LNANDAKATLLPAGKLMPLNPFFDDATHVGCWPATGCDTFTELAERLSLHSETVELLSVTVDDCEASNHNSRFVKELGLNPLALVLSNRGLIPMD
jgi:hypothetical protein